MEITLAQEGKIKELKLFNDTPEMNGLKLIRILKDPLTKEITVQYKGNDNNNNYFYTIDKMGFFTFLEEKKC